MRSYRRPLPAARRGFTIVELLVALALCVTIMAIISAAFSVGLESFRQLKAIGDMTDQMRAASTQLRSDLGSPHFEDELGSPVRVSDPRLGTPDSPGVKWANAAPPFGAPVVGPVANSPVRRGFLSVVQGSAPMQNISLAVQTATGYAYNAAVPTSSPPYYPPGYYWYEGTDPDMESMRATDHVLAMAVKRAGKTAQDGYTSAVPGPLNVSQLSRTDFDPTGTQFYSQWAEVTYFLRSQGFVFTDNADGTITPLPLYSLHRRQRALTPSPVFIGPPTTPPPIGNGNEWRERFPDLSIRAEPVLTPGPMGVPGLPVQRVESWTNTAADVATVGPTGVPDRRMSSFVDWRTYTGGPPVPQFRPLPAGLYEVGAGAALDGQVVNAERYGSDVLLNNVISFQVRVLADANVTFGNPNGTAFVDPPPALPVTSTAWPRVYDTATAGFRIKAVKTVIRVWDAKTKQTRQVSIIQDL